MSIHSFSKRGERAHRAILCFVLHKMLQFYFFACFKPLWGVSDRSESDGTVQKIKLACNNEHS